MAAMDAESIDAIPTVKPLDLMRHLVRLVTPAGGTLQFELGGRYFRFAIDRPTPDEMLNRDGRDYSYPQNVDWAKKADDEWRRRWRAHVLLIKAKLEFIEGGDTTLEREFLPYAVLSDGRTVGQMLAAGGLPMLEAGS